LKKPTIMSKHTTNVNKLILGSAAALLVSGLFAFNVLTAGTIKGTVVPADGASRAWAISPTDTLRASITNGAYEIKDAKPGAYRIIIEAKPPFKNAAKDSVTVMDGQAAEVGEIRLEQ
jgi:hypothetical protein